MLIRLPVEATYFYGVRRRKGRGAESNSRPRFQKLAIYINPSAPQDSRVVRVPNSQRAIPTARSNPTPHPTPSQPAWPQPTADPARSPAMEAAAEAGSGRREAALGGLAVLPDEVLCAVVDLLSPTDIGRLACVSRSPQLSSTLLSLVLSFCN